MFFGVIIFFHAYTTSKIASSFLNHHRVYPLTVYRIAWQWVTIFFCFSLFLSSSIAMQRVPPLVYIYKEESVCVCVCVCSLCIPIRYNRFWWNFPGMISTSRGRSTCTWFEKKPNPAHATGNLCNWPIGLQHMKMWTELVAKAAKGRLSAHTRHLTCFAYLWEPGGCYGQPGKLTNGIAAFEKVTENGSEGGQRPSERSYTRPKMFQVSMATLWLLRAT